MDFLIVTLSAQIASYNLDSHAFLLSSKVLLMTFNKLLFVDSACPFPYGWYGEDVDLVIPYLSQNFINSLDLKHMELSITIL